MTDSQRWWLSEGLMISGGWHPITGRIRRGIPHEHLESAYDWEYTEEHVGRLKELGVTLLIGQFDRGLGDTDQADDQDRARRLADLCHQHGIRHACYMANTVYFESMLKDYPDCEDWVVKTHDGRRVHYGGLQSFRWVACFHSPGWRARMKRQVDRAADFVGTDGLHFDSLAVWPEPDSCHCDYCAAAFREFLERRYPAEADQKRRFGFTGFETFRPPNFYMRFIPPWEVDRIDNPLMQEWIEFRQWTVTDYIRDLAEHARSKNPALVIDSNGQSVWGCNQALIHGIDAEAQSAHVDFVCEENPDFRAEEHPQAIYPVTHKMRGLNYYRGLGKPTMTAYKDEQTLALNLTLSGNPGINQAWGYAEPGRAPLRPHQPGVKELLDHWRRNRPLYVAARSAARIAVWRESKSLAFVSTDTHLSACVIEQLLFDSRIPFRIVSSGVVNTDELGAFDVLILPDVEFIGDATIERLTEFVRAGGSLLITEKSGQYTDAPRRRARPALAHLFAGPLRATATSEVEAANIDPNAQFRLLTTAGQPALTRFGSGRAVYLPKIDYVYPPHTFQSRYNVRYDGIDSRYWKPPHNQREILDAIDWLSPSARPIRAVGGRELRIDLIELADGTLAVPLLRCGDLDGPAPVGLVVRAARAPAAAALHSPECDAPTPLAFEQRPDGFGAELPGVCRHAVVALGIRREDLT